MPYRVKNLTRFFWKFRKKNNPLQHNIPIGMKEKTKQLKAEISKSLSAITDIGERVEKKSIRKKIAALAEDLRKLLKKETKKKEKEAAKAVKKAGKAEKKAAKKVKAPVSGKAEAGNGQPVKKSTASKSGTATAAVKKEAAETAVNLKAEVWKSSDKE